MTWQYRAAHPGQIEMGRLATAVERREEFWQVMFLGRYRDLDELWRAAKNDGDHVVPRQRISERE